MLKHHDHLLQLLSSNMLCYYSIAPDYNLHRADYLIPMGDCLYLQNKHRMSMDLRLGHCSPRLVLKLQADLLLHLQDLDLMADLVDYLQVHQL